jgi:hypothetical protein
LPCPPGRGVPDYLNFVSVKAGITGVRSTKELNQIMESIMGADQKVAIITGASQGIPLPWRNFAASYRKIPCSKAE